MREIGIVLLETQGGKKTCQKKEHIFWNVMHQHLQKMLLITNLVQCGPQIMSHIQQCKHMTIKIFLSSGMWHHVVRQECTNISGTPPEQRQQDPLNSSIFLPDYWAVRSTSGQLQVLPSGKENRFAPLLTVPPEAIIWALADLRRSERQGHFPEFSFEVTILVLFIWIWTPTLTPAQTQTWSSSRIRLIYFRNLSWTGPRAVGSILQLFFENSYAGVQDMSSK